LFIPLVYGTDYETSVWPQPANFKTGGQVVSVNPPLLFHTVGGEIETLTQAYARYTSIIFPHLTDKINISTVKNVEFVTEVNVEVQDRSEAYPDINTDESYELTIPDDSKSIVISSQTIYGALLALETLSQLIIFNFEEEMYKIPNVPISIQDAPRYPHRGMLLDTSRHFQPIPELRRTIDALSYAKYNVLHWHVVDTQSFPFQSLSSPRLWEGAYSEQERYSHSDILGLIEYGRARGIRIMIEFDMPGHGASWCTGYPDICPSPNCLQPLDPSSSRTFPLIDALLGECTGYAPGAGMFPYSFIHLGGDEVDYSCWDKSPKIQKWAQSQNLSDSEAIYAYFVDWAASTARTQGRTPVQWVEVFEHFGSALDNNTIVHVWKDKTTLNTVVLAGYRALLSDEDLWYLDHLETTWELMYNNEPTSVLSPQANASLILGGESCMWGETVDASDLDNTVWPRAAAVAERLWTPLALMNVTAAEPRLETFRCLLTQRGIGAAPVTNIHARFAPKDPGSCYLQRRLISKEN